jgi:hypothetical protein
LLVHNSVNKRLARESISGNDPVYPKELFPTVKQCPKCYVTTTSKIEDFAEHESPFKTKETLLFLSSFYSKYHIEPIKSNRNLLNPIAKNAADVTVVKMLPNEPDALVAKAESTAVGKDRETSGGVGGDDAYDAARLRDQESLNKVLDGRRRNLDILLIENNYSLNGQSSSRVDIGLSVFAVSLVLIVFVLMYFYFASSRRKPKLQKHII